jgi:flavin reductase (DIM6/NTAB) family NADH-FMN oxidoreductase RutF
MPQTQPEKLAVTPSIGPFYSWPIVLVTCVDANGVPNIITLGASAPCSARPPTIGIAVAPARYSHSLIAQRGEFAVNIPRATDLEKVDLCGCVSGRDHDKFAETGYTAIPGAAISVPIIAECPVNLECRVVHTANLGSHDWFIGEIVAARADSAVLDDNGRVDHARVQSVFSWWARYCSAGKPLQPWGFAQPT